jgi:hypothetical protein
VTVKVTALHFVQRIPMAEFRNFYRCPDCHAEWDDIWSCTGDDEGPECGARDISPYESDDYP